MVSAAWNLRSSTAPSRPERTPANPSCFEDRPPKPFEVFHVSSFLPVHQPDPHPNDPFRLCSAVLFEPLQLGDGAESLRPRSSPSCKSSIPHCRRRSGSVIKTLDHVDRNTEINTPAREVPVPGTPCIIGGPSFAPRVLVSLTVNTLSYLAWPDQDPTGVVNGHPK